MKRVKNAGCHSHRRQNAPTGTAPADIDSVHEVLNVEHMEGPSSTDCNIPLSMGIPAICLGVVRDGKVHTREEWVEVASLSEGCKLLLNFLYR